MISIQDIQAAYFDILEMHFGKIFSQMQSQHLSPDQMAARMANIRDYTNSWVSKKEHFLKDMKHFWDSHAQVIISYLQRLRSLKVVFGGDLLPPFSSNMVCSKGLYIDTLLLTDPILRIFGLFKMMRKEQQINYMLRHVLGALNFRDFALAGVDPPIVVIVPDSNLLEPNHQLYLTAISERDAISHFEAMFDHVFSTRKSLDAFLEQFRTLEELEGAICHTERLLFNIHWRGPLVEQIKRYHSGVKKEFRMNIAEEGIGKMLYPVVLGRMLQINDAILKSRTYQCDLLIEEPTLWQYLIWKYHYDAEPFKEDFGATNETLISRRLTMNGKDEWSLISNIDSKTLIDLRKKGVLADFRAIFRKGIQDINEAENSDVKAVFEQSMNTIRESFKQHEKLLMNAALKKEGRLFEQNLARWSRAYAVSIAGALTGNISLSIISSFKGKEDFTSGADAWKKPMDLSLKGKKLKRLPVAICFIEKKSFKDMRFI